MMKGQIIKYFKKLLLVQSIILSFFSCYACAQTITRNETGNQEGFYYSFWNDYSSGTASICLKAKGRYRASWTNIGNFTAGKGWQVGKEDRIISYSGKFNGGSNGLLAIYGWTRDSLVEYYIVENYGEFIPPPGGISLGTFASDGGNYHIYKTIRVNQPSIVGITTFYQYWSVRTTKRSMGKVTFANHVRAWKSKGMVLGKVWDYQIMETEGYKSSGYADIKVKEGASSVPD